MMVSCIVNSGYRFACFVLDEKMVLLIQEGLKALLIPFSTLS